MADVANAVQTMSYGSGAPLSRGNGRRGARPPADGSWSSMFRILYAVRIPPAGVGDDTPYLKLPSPRALAIASPKVGPSPETAGLLPTGLGCHWAAQVTAPGRKNSILSGEK